MPINLPATLPQTDAQRIARHLRICRRLIEIGEALVAAGHSVTVSREIRLIQKMEAQLIAGDPVSKQFYFEKKNQKTSIH